MKLRNFLADNHEVLRGKILEWSFGKNKYQLEVLSSVKVQYRSKTLGWTRSDIVGLRHFEVISLTARGRRLSSPATLYLVTTE